MLFRHRLISWSLIRFGRGPLNMAGGIVLNPAAVRTSHSEAGGVASYKTQDLVEADRFAEAKFVMHRLPRA